MMASYDPVAIGDYTPYELAGMYSAAERLVSAALAAIGETIDEEAQP
jgi:hypothetical protein